MKKIIYFIIIVFLSNFGFGQVTDLFITKTSDFKLSTKNQYTFVENQFNGNYTKQIGAPQLPVFTRNYFLPAGSIVSNITYSNGSKIVMGSNFYVYPVQPLCPLNGKPCPDFVEPDSAIYNNSNAFPTETGTIISDANVLGNHIIKLDICPFEYIPNQKKLSYYNQINITIQYSIGQIEYTKRITEHRNKLNKDFVLSSVQNPTAISTNYKTANQIITTTNTSNKLHIPWKPSAYGDIPDYIIITNQSLKQYFDTLATFKTQKGIPTVVVTVEQIYQNYPGCDNPEKIRNYLKDAYRNWGAGLFILLGGDTAIVPGRIGIEGSNNYTDMYYCDVYKPTNPNYNWNSNGDSGFGFNGDALELGSDNFIGRAPVDTIVEVQNFVNKIISYENLTGVTDKSYVNNMLFLGSYYTYNHDTNIGVGADDSIPDEVYGGQQWHFKLANKPFLANPNLNKWLVFDDYLGNSHQDYPGNEELSRTTALDRMSNGYSGFGKFHLVSHYDHGSPFVIGTSSSMKLNAINKADMDGLNNGSYYQIMYSTACDDGEFDKDCFAEHYVNATQGGGVAMIANSGTVGVRAEEQDNQLFNSIYGNLSPSSYIMGVAFANTREANSASYELYRVKMLTLFGEPTMATWSATPQNIALTVPSTVTIDNAIANLLPVTINALSNDATVAVYKYNTVTNEIEVYASQIIPAGGTATQFTLNPDTAGTMTVKVTAHNYLPATATVNILLPQAHLYVTGYSFTDSNGNGYIEQGETITLTVNLTNSGNTSINLIHTVLSSNPIFATINNATVTNPQINPEQTVMLTGFTFMAQVANGTVILPDFIAFFLNITADGGYTHLDNFFLDLKNPALNMGKRTVTNAAGPISSFTTNDNVNLNVFLNNTGSVPTGALTATLTTTLGNVVITTASTTYPNIINGIAEQQNSTPFVFKFTDAIPSGAKPFTLTVTSTLGKIWTFNFDLNEPLPPLITNFHFTATKSEIKSMWNPISNIQGYSIYRSTEIDGTYTKLNTFLVTGSALYNDTELNNTTIYYYKISAVSLSGNELPLELLVANKAWTAFDYHGAFPKEANDNIFCNASPTLYDVDADGRKEIFITNNIDSESSGRILGFYDSGQELYDIDGNPTTVSGFATTNISMKSNAAVGDLDNDGHAEVIAIGRNNTTNQGKLFAYKTVDLNGDNKPDKFWNDELIDFGWRVGTNPVLYDVDHNGFLDIIVVDEKQKIYVYDKDKNVLPGWPIQITTGIDYSLGHIAVADINHDGKGEIAIGLKAFNGSKGAIFIYNYNGTPFSTNPFKEFADNERADGGIVFADIDNDLNLDLLITTKQVVGSTGKIYAFKQDGTPVNSVWNGTITFNVKNVLYFEATMPRIAVGDLNHDGNLEIVFGSKGQLYVLDKNGITVSGFPKPIIDVFDDAPILADVDNDNDVEIVINNDGKLQGYNYDGTDCVGFPLESVTGFEFVGSPSIDDIDNDGKNEMVIATHNGTTYVYKTTGYSDKIEWGSYRGNPHNTGTYKEVCNNVLDLMIRDGLTDVGSQPNTITPYMWTSPDIWIRKNDDGVYEPQNAEYSTTTPNFAYVRVTNKSCVASSGTALVKLYYAKAGISFNWPDTWDGTHYFPAPNNTVKMGEPVGTMQIPSLQPGQTTVVKFPFMVPNPALYAGINNVGEPWHFCMLARIEATNDIPIETIDLYQNVKNNNNLGWVNFSVIDAISDTEEPINSEKIGALVAVGNPYNEAHNFFIEIVKEELETGKDIYKEAEVSIKMNDVLYNAWERGGKIAQQVDETLDEKKKIVKENHVILDNIFFNAKEMGTLSLKFNFLTQELTEKTKFVYHIIQKDAQNGKIIGGETYIIRKKPRAIFIADAGGDKVVDANLPITISAAQISEPVIYNWYDSEGNLIFTGKDLQIANAVAEKYKLEVISTVDGFKDYSEMEVKINPNRLKSVAPNPVNNATKIYYNLNEVSSAYLMIVSYYMNSGISNNYLLDVNSTETTINFSNYPSGFYNVVLVTNGLVSGTKIIYKPN